MIDPKALIGYAVRFSLGRFDVDTLTDRPPVYVEKVRAGWVVRAEHPGSMNPYYLNAEPPRWRYKRGTSFTTAEEALESFNAWLAEAGEEKR